MKVTERTVIVVHGIGQQTVGATATAWIESFLQFCRAQGRRAEVTANQLDRDDGPACATLVVGAPGTQAHAVVGEPVLRLRIVEARWSEAFTAPGALNVLRWLLWFGPNFAHAQVFLARRAHQDLRRAAQVTIAENGSAPELTTADTVAHKATSAASGLGPLLYLVGGLVLLAVAGPIVVLLGLIAGLGGLIPSERVRAAATKVLSVVSGQIGDVSTYLTSPIARGAMEQIIDDCVRGEVAAVGARNVHVLAHSQGAALSHAVLARLPRCDRPRRFTTVGAAHGRLHEMRLLEFPSWTVVPIVLTALSWLLAFPIHGRFGRDGLLIAPGAVSVVTLCLLLWAGRKSARDFERKPSPGILSGVSWLDMWAPFDPVPNGRPVARSSREYLGLTVPGRMTFLIDHVHYATDWHETVPRALAHITLGLPAKARLGARRGVRARKSLGDPKGQRPNWTPWSRRDWVSFACRGLALVAGLGLVVFAGPQVMSIGAKLRGIGPWAETAATWAGEQWGRWWALLGGEAGNVVGGTNRVIGGVGVRVAAILVANIVKARYWGAVDAEARDWARSIAWGGAPRRWTTGRWVVRGGVVVLVWLGLVVGLVAVVTGAPWS